MDLATVAAAVSCVMTAKSLVEAIKNGNSIGFVQAAISLIQKVPLSREITGGAEVAFMGSRSPDVTSSSSGTTHQQQTMSLSDISFSQLADAFKRADVDGTVTVFHLNNDRGTTQRFLVIGGKGGISLEGGLPSSTAPVDNLASKLELEKIIFTIQSVASFAIRLAVGSKAAALFDGAATVVRHIAKIQGLGSGGGEVTASPEVQQRMALHQELGNAVTSAKSMFTTCEDRTPKECLQIHLQSINNILPTWDGGGQFTVLGAQPDYGIVQRVDDRNLTHTYFISQVLNAVQGMLHLTEFTVGIDPATGNPVFKILPVGGEEALAAAMVTPGFDTAIQTHPSSSQNIDANFTSDQQQQADFEKKKEEAINFHAASGAYHLSASCSGARGATPSERLKNYFANEGYMASPELKEAVFMEGDDDYAILYNEKTNRTFTLIRGTEFGITQNAIDDVVNDIMFGKDLTQSPRFTKIQSKVDAFVEKNPEKAKNMVVSGHSLGGGIAVGLGHHNPDFKVMAFNPFGVPPLTFFKKIDDGSFSLQCTKPDCWKNITVVHIKSDPFSSVFTRVTNLVGGNAETRKIPGVTCKNAHNLSNFKPTPEVSEAVWRDYEEHVSYQGGCNGKQQP